MNVNNVNYKTFVVWWALKFIFSSSILTFILKTQDTQVEDKKKSSTKIWQIWKNYTRDGVIV